MEKSLLDHLNEFGYSNPKLVMSTLKALAYSGVTNIDILLKMKTEEILRIKGIGPKSMALISKMLTKERAIRENKKAVYDKYCHEIDCISLRDWFQKTGLTYLSACQLEQILKRGGINSIDVFMKTTFGEFEAMKGIGKKRIETIAKVKKMIDKKKQTGEKS